MDGQREIGTSRGEPAMTDIDVDAIEARAQATPYGPWEVGEWVKGLGYAIWAGDGDLLVYADPPGGHYLGGEVEALIVNARPDILALVSRIRELEAFRGHVLDVKRFGLRVDLNPTRKFFESAEEADSWWSDYLRGIDVEARKSAARLLDGSETPVSGCTCVTCDESGWPRFHVCAVCGNKRCPKSSWHGYRCTGSNATGQTPEVETP